jgi:transcriptional regulator with XRE-family HTH domain
MSLSEKLKMLRQKTGQSLQQVADGVGVSKVHIWELEKGTSQNPSLDLLRRLAAHFKVPINYFHEDQIEPEQVEALQFFREFDGKLSDKEWQALRSMAEALRSKDEK